MKVKNMTSRNGNKVANQFIIKEDRGACYFQSYDSIIVKIEKNGKILLDVITWKYSITTSKYRSLFLNESTKETQSKIDSGEYTLTNLN